MGTEEVIEVYWDMWRPEEDEEPYVYESGVGLIVLMFFGMFLTFAFIGIALLFFRSRL